MRKVLLKEMLSAWREYDRDNDVVDPDFYEGFEAACEFLIPLLEQSSNYVYAYICEGHELYGFRPRKRSLDDFVNTLKDVLGE